MNSKNITKNELVTINAALSAEVAALRAEVSALRVSLEAKPAAPKAEAPVKKSRVLRVKEHVYATAAEAKAAFARLTEWAKSREAHVSLSGVKVYVKVPM